ncbi:PAC2 family protein [Microlunatus soli]|uniref:Predicted ATP-dependent carboligase, ATP-grasp superfamily n=1 Tax=Microlunatus soli TaxID=630515 RepID=A0A1H1ZR40_9ACTN|nr:PAC2 family protein [Microlunatus soli]SDT36103.1 Predicted ATP-dependent carboligase, ATP-grasp superfamily [Microlunatus soli]
MLDPSSLYELTPGADELMAGSRPVLIVQLEGFIDAGQAGRLFTEHLLEHTEHQVLAEFDHDQLHDYRSRRPMMDYDGNRWSSLETPRLRLHRMIDAQDEPFLLLTGPEPDVQWERVAAAVIGLIDTFDVRLVVSLTGIPGAVPHTRPVALNAHSTDPELVREEQAWFGKAEVQASFSAMLEFRLGEQGRTAMGFEAFVPHYLAQAAFPQATLTLGQRIAQTTGLVVPLGPLEEAAASNMAEIVEEVAGSSEAQEMVGQLEQQYDTLRADRGGIGFPPPSSEDLASVPSADEIGAAFERFLAEREDPEDDGQAADGTGTGTADGTGAEGGTGSSEDATGEAEDGAGEDDDTAGPSDGASNGPSDQ